MGGGGKTPSVPTPPEPEPIPEPEKEPATNKARDAELLRLRSATGHRGNIVTSPLGIIKQS